MKILLINHFPLTGSGSGVYTKNLAKGLINNGHKVHIVVPENTKNSEKIDNAKIHYVYFKREEEIRNQLDFNFPCFTTHPRSSMTFYDLDDKQLKDYIENFTKVIEQAINELKPNIIHSQHIWILSCIASKYNIPLIVTAHGTDIIGYTTDKRFSKYAEETLKKSKKIITISKDNNNLVLENFKNAKSKTVCIENGYDEEVFYKCDYDREEILQELNIKGEFNKVVTFAGKLTYCKGVDLLLNAAKAYEKKDILTLIVGDGKLKKELKMLTKELKLENVYFIGNKAQDTLRKIYNVSDVVVIPSREEAFGLVAIEALACGIPVICTNVGGMSEFVNDKVGSVIQINNVSALKNDILKIINKEKKYDKKYIAEYAKKYYSKSIFVKKIEKLYKKYI